MFLKMKNEDKGNSRYLFMRRRGSSGSSDEEEEAAEDMGLFGSNLTEFKKK